MFLLSQFWHGRRKKISCVFANIFIFYLILALICVTLLFERRKKNSVLIQEMIDLQCIERETDVAPKTLIRHTVFQVEKVQAKEWTVTL